MSVQDRYTTMMGIAVVAEAEGEVWVEMTVRDDHVNALGRLHGGALFSVADAAISRAAHRRDHPSVVTSATMTFLRPTSVGDRLVAHAVEEHRGRRLGSYRAEVRCGDTQVATAVGKSMPV